MSGKHIDLSSDPSPPKKGPEKRRYLGIQFDCCNVYSRIYANRDGTAYIGNCPKCAKQVRLRIGPGGTDNRFFTVS